MIVLFVLAWLAYHPGLSGGFLFDDFINLDALGNSGAIDNWPTFWRYLTSGTADPIGRPVALLSFLIDARNWPADPAPFLRTNLLLHLLNGALLFSLLRRLGSTLNTNAASNDAAALIASGMWLLHPLFVSTTLYAVQREAMLPATFTLLGLLAYVHGRVRFAQTEGSQGTAWLVSGICMGTLLAVLSKANGLLLPLLAGTLEITIFWQGTLVPVTPAAVKKLRQLNWLFLVLPSVLIFAYLAHLLPSLNADIGRSWTLAQRLMTEPRILLDYLNLLVLPRSVSTGLYNDNYVVSLNLWQPLGTLPAMLLVSGLVILAFRARRFAPSLSAALMFFFAGHLLESTIVPLELYFEHRNYLPALLLFWPFARALCAWRIARPVRITIAVAAIALLAATTYQRAQLWGQPERLALLWIKQNPDSSRALATVANQLVNSGHPQQALELLGPKWRQRPDDVQIAISYINAACAWRGLQRDDVQALARTLRLSHDRQDMAFRWLADAVNLAGDGKCIGLDLDDVEFSVLELQKNTAYHDSLREQNLQSLFAQIALWRRQPDLALYHFDRALFALVRPEVAARQVAMLGSSGYYQHALAHLNTYERVKGRVAATGAGMPWLHGKILQWQDYWPNEFTQLRRRLRTEIDAQQDPDRQFNPANRIDTQN